MVPEGPECCQSGPRGVPEDPRVLGGAEGGGARGVQRAQRAKDGQEVRSDEIWPDEQLISKERSSSETRRRQLWSLFVNYGPDIDQFLRVPIN